MRERRFVHHCANNFWNLGGDDFTKEISGSSGRVRGSDEGAHYSDTIESLGGRTSRGENRCCVAGVYAANANGRNRAVACVMKSREYITDTRGANDGFGVFFTEPVLGVEPYIDVYISLTSGWNRQFQCRDSQHRLCKP